MRNGAYVEDIAYLQTGVIATIATATKFSFLGRVGVLSRSRVISSVTPCPNLAKARVSDLRFACAIVDIPESYIKYPTTPISR